MKFVNLILLFLLLLAAGCAPIVDENTQKFIIEKDPQFKEVLDKKLILDAQIDDLKAKLRDKIDEINTKINALRDELRFCQNEITRQITSLKSELDPERSKITSQISLVRDDLRAKTQNLKTLNNTKKNIEKLVKKNQGIEFSKDDIIKWGKELNEINGRIIPLEEDIKILNFKIKFLKLKLASLRQ